MRSGIDIAVGVGHGHQAIFDRLVPESGFPDSVVSFGRQSFLRARRVDLVLPIVNDLLSHPQFRIHVRDQLRAGPCHRLIGAGRFGMPVRVDHRPHVPGQFEDVLRMNGISTIHKETPALARKDENIIPCARDQRDFIADFRGGKVSLRGRY